MNTQRTQEHILQLQHGAAVLAAAGYAEHIPTPLLLAENGFSKLRNEPALQPLGKGMAERKILAHLDTLDRAVAVGGAEGGWSAPCLKVFGIVSAQGGVTLDIGGSESSPLPIGTRVKVVEVAAGGSFPSIRVVGVCERRSSIALSRVAGANGVTEVWAEVVPLGTVLHLR